MSNPSTYYQVCKKCGATLDPGERCDCEPKKIIYLCDRRACSFCNPDCSHTYDISHAKNFELNRQFMVEKEK